MLNSGLRAPGNVFKSIDDKAVGCERLSVLIDVLFVGAWVGEVGYTSDVGDVRSRGR